jgi:hypothetical protein
VKKFGAGVDQSQETSASDTDNAEGLHQDELPPKNQGEEASAENNRQR